MFSLWISIFHWLDLVNKFWLFCYDFTSFIKSFPRLFFSVSKKRNSFQFFPPFSGWSECSVWTDRFICAGKSEIYVLSDYNSSTLIQLIGLTKIYNLILAVVFHLLLLFSYNFNLVFYFSSLIRIEECSWLTFSP